MIIFKDNISVEVLAKTLQKGVTDFFYLHISKTTTTSESKEYHLKKKSWAELFYTAAKKKLHLKTLPKQSQILSMKNC